MAHDLCVAEDMACIQTIETHKNDVTSVDFGIDAMLASGSGDGMARLWTWVSEDNCYIEADCSPLIGHKYGVNSVCFSPQGTMLLTGCGDGSSIVWNVKSESEPEDEAEVSGPGGGKRLYHRYLAATGGNDNAVRLWDVRSPACGGCGSEVRAEVAPAEPHHALLGHGSAVTSVRFARAGSLLLSASLDKTARIWQVSSGACLSVVRGHTRFVFAVAASRCGTLLATGSYDQKVRVDKMVRLWVRENATSRFAEADCSPLEGHRYSVLAAEFAPGPSPQLATCSLDGEALLWDIQAGERADSPLQCAGGGALRTLRISPDGHLLATAGDDEKVDVWSLHSGEMLLSAEGHTDAVAGLAISPDSQLLVSCSADGSIRMWALSPPSAQGLFVLEAAHDLGALTVDFSPSEGMPGKCRLDAADEDKEARGKGKDGHCYLLASGGNDEAVRLWRVRARFDGGVLAYSGECLHVLEGHTSLLTSVAFSPDCSLLATGSLDKVVMVWQLPAHLVFQLTGPDGSKSHTKRVVDWSPEDVDQWLREWGMPRLGGRARVARVYGVELITCPVQDVLTKLQGCEAGEASVEDVDVAAAVDGAENEDEIVLEEHIVQLIHWLKHAEATGSFSDALPDEEPPPEFLCPITHEVMRDPVICSDGFTYERAALSEWLLGRRFSSPMTNVPLSSSRLLPNVALRRRILEWMFGEVPPLEDEFAIVQPSAPGESPNEDPVEVEEGKEADS
ncbi:Protein Notchless [Gryllus bimaculatus]|nr:Protein Notchless [Gryllus bimaculatus]